MDQRAQPRLLALSGAARRVVELLERPWQAPWLLDRHDDARHALYYSESQSHAAADAARADLFGRSFWFRLGTDLVDRAPIPTVSEENLVYVMLFLIVILVIFIYAPLAVRLLTRGGPRRLWLGFIAALSLLLSLAFVAAAVYAVPN